VVLSAILYLQTMADRPSRPNTALDGVLTSETRLYYLFQDSATIMDREEALLQFLRETMDSSLDAMVQARLLRGQHAHNSIVSIQHVCIFNLLLRIS
jgi:hypothetical protein